MGCCHYLDLVYGTFVKKAFILEKYHAEFEKYKQESDYNDYSDSDFLLNFEKSYKDVTMRFHETGEHGFEDDVLIGFSIESDENGRKMESKIGSEMRVMPVNANFSLYNDFFAELSIKTPRIIAFMGGCGCCS